MNFRYRLMQFMQGRYGVDSSFFVLFGVSAVLALINAVLRLWYLQIIIYIISIIAILRFLSRNIEARRKENNAIMGGVYALSNWYRTIKTRRADKTHIYKKCPNCKAVLRLPRRKGKHTTVCPNCSKEFKVRVYR